MPDQTPDQTIDYSTRPSLSPLSIETVPCLKDNLSYLIVNLDENLPVLQAIAVDPGEAAPFYDRLKQLEQRFLKPVEIAAVLTTHHHHDHIGGLADFPAVPTWASKRDQTRIPSAGGRGHTRNLSVSRSYSWSDLTAQSAHASKSDQPAKPTFSILEIPGHTEGQIAIRLQAGNDSNPESHLFVGDTLFSMGCGRCLEGTPEQLFESLQQIKLLPQETYLHFGHEYSRRNLDFWMEMQSQYPDEIMKLLDTTAIQNLENELAVRGFQHRRAPTLAQEVKSNPFLKIKNATEFCRWRFERNQF